MEGTRNSKSHSCEGRTDEESRVGPFAAIENCLARDNFVDSRDSNRSQYGTVSGFTR